MTEPDKYVFRHESQGYAPAGCPPRVVEVTVTGATLLDAVLASFTDFLRACGYQIEGLEPTHADDDTSAFVAQVIDPLCDDGAPAPKRKRRKTT